MAFKVVNVENELTGAVEHVQKIDLGISDAFYYYFGDVFRVPKVGNRNLYSENPIPETKSPGIFKANLAGNLNSQDTL